MVQPKSTMRLFLVWALLSAIGGLFIDCQTVAGIKSVEGCGDGSCSGNEDCVNCQSDCGVCSRCRPEISDPCCLDRDVCGLAGDGVCQCSGACSWDGEDCSQCPGAGCPDCGDGHCAPPAENVTTCPTDCAECGDGLCTADETVQSCPGDCPGCGDGICDKSEDPESCPADCLCATCGDFITNGGTLCSGYSTDLYNQLNDCACDGACKSVCGNNVCMGMDVTAECQTCVLDALGCGTEFGECANDI